MLSRLTSIDYTLSSVDVISEYLQQISVDGLSNSGWDVSPYELKEIPSIEKAKNILILEEADKLLVLDVNRWFYKTDTHFNTSFKFESDVDVIVFDKNRDEYLKENLSDIDIVKEHGDRHNDVVGAFRDRLGKILSSEIVMHLLEGNPPPKTTLSKLNSKYDAVSKLKKMLDRGAITTEEYNREKQLVLDQ